MKYIDRYLAVLMLIFAIGFNLRLYRLEPTALVDPNDNTFQFALVDRTNQIWDFATKQCSKNFLTFGICHLSYLADHWVPNWAEGYNLPYYYSHLPQIVIVASWRLASVFLSHLTLYQYYHWIIYLLLCFFPLPVFVALRVIGLPWLGAGFGALLATQVSTDGLYGLDPPSFLWRGYGLSSQLFAMIFLPLAIAYSWRWMSQRNFQFSIFNFQLNLRGVTINRTGDASEGLPPHASPERVKGSLWSIRHYFTSELKRVGGTRERQDPLKGRFAETTYRPQRDFWLAVFFLFATTAGHLGIGIIVMMSIGIIALTPPLLAVLNREPFRNFVETAVAQLTKLALLAGTALFFLSYWVLPVVLNGNYHNISYWDPIWKFNSYDWITTVTRFFNGDLFDFGRFPVYTLLVLLGVFVALWPDNSIKESVSSIEVNNRKEKSYSPSLIRNTNPYSPFALLFAVWMLLYFGRTTWGGLIDLIPGMKEFHISRFIVGLHLAGFFLAPIALVWLTKESIAAFHWFQKKVIGITHASYSVRLLDYLIIVFLLLILLPPIYRQTIRYNELNDRLIIQANNNATAVQADADKLFATIREQLSTPRSPTGIGGPGRVFAGRGGWWGKDFRVAETPYYMHLSTYGIPTVLWLPETWSPNSDTEQYFSEDVARDYDLYNIHYVAAPPAQASQKFWKQIAEAPSWKLYEVPTSGYFTTGVTPAIVAVNKQSYLNVVRLWIQSPTPEAGLFPELTFARGYPKSTGLPNFKMVDEVTYVVPDGSRHNVFAEPPLYLPPGVTSKEQFAGLTKNQYVNIQLVGPEEDDTDMIFKTKVTVGDNCTQCIIVLKQSFHPDWVAYIDGRRVKPVNVFPFFVGVPVSQQGTHDITVDYEPSRLKVILLVVEGIAILTLIGLWWKSRILHRA